MLTDNNYKLIDWYLESMADDKRHPDLLDYILWCINQRQNKDEIRQELERLIRGRTGLDNPEIDN